MNERPSKPRPDFPLFPHANGKWCKKIKGRFHYFGKWADDPDGSKALVKYIEQRDDLHAGRKPRQFSGDKTVRHLLNDFLDGKKHLLDTGELSPRTFAGYKRTCDRIAETFGLSRPLTDLGPDDFLLLRRKFSKGRGTFSLASEVRHARIVAKFAYDSGMVDRPIRVGPTFREPNKKAKRRARRESGQRLFEADELRTIIGAARQPLKAMILLAVNCGFGQSDIASLPKSAIDLDGGWIDFPRPKTEVDRRCPLWPETIEALREALPLRPKPKDKADDRLAFLTRNGFPVCRMEQSLTDPTGWAAHDTIQTPFNRLLNLHGLKRSGVAFYALRHTFRTVADGSKDQPAINSIMGHDPGDMASLYRERIGDDRLQAVTDHVRAWIWPTELDQNMRQL